MRLDKLLHLLVGAYRARLLQAGKLLEARAVLHCIKLIQTNESRK